MVPSPSCTGAKGSIIELKLRVRAVGHLGLGRVVELGRCLGMAGESVSLRGGDRRVVAGAGEIGEVAEVADVTARSGV